jgi:hypothetical protein
MARSDSVWTEAVAHSDMLLQLVQDISPTQQITIPTAHIHILGMSWRARRLYKGVLILLKAELPEEAAFLARALFEKSLHLQQLAAEPEKRDALILGWYNRPVDEKQSLRKVAEQLGLDHRNIDDNLTSLEQERGRLFDYARRHGVAKLHWAGG